MKKVTKKVFNIFLLSTFIFLQTNFASALDLPFLKKEKQEKEQTEQTFETLINSEEIKKTEQIKEKKEKKQKIKKEKIKESKAQEEKIEIVKPQKDKINPKREKKKKLDNDKTKQKSSKEAQGMYETKFPAITSKIEYTEGIKEVTLEDCIKLALNNHPSIMSAMSNSEIYKTKIAQAWSNYFPTLGAGVSYSRNDSLMTMRASGAYSSMMDRKYDMYYTPTLSANMLIFDFGKTKATADMAKRNYESSRYDAEMSIEQVIYNVKVAYYNLLFAHAQKIVYEDTVKDYELQLKQASAFFKIGKKAKIDVTTAEYNLGNAKVNLIKAKNTLELAAVQLANAVGIPEMESVKLLDELNTKAYEVNFDELINIAKDSRPSLLSAKKKMDAAEMDLRASKREFTPNVNAFASYNRGGAKMDMDYGYQAGFELSYSGINLLNLKKQVDEARATYRKYVADYEAERQNVYLEVKSAYISLLNSHDSFVVAKLALQQAKEQQYQAYRRYQVGLGNAIEFKDAENTYLNAQLNYYSNLLEYNVNAAELERVVGAPIKESSVDL